ncbi:tyrosine-protein kinase domain-containing protein [Alkalinema sp. FACHB-956]|uniref:GumC family protein n=1 Tax=Alkalinema sp. FACHB-956 TaxID=2692768 RepID=UPI00168955A2|nr:tyrosine-protein kinase domain-containing protein [Alkalinema sp. FACHB-956]MBD2327339.1 polysaccharide biosynthesis tyrosine autokinase [Alkalinema sp. FACHB-956]
MTSIQLNSTPTTAEPELGYGQLFGVLWRNRILIFLGLLAGLGMGGLVTLRQTPTYVSNMQLLIEPTYQGKSQGAKLQDEFTDPEVSIDPATQISLLQSSDLLRQAIVKLEGKYPEFSSQNPASVFALKSGLSIIQVASGEKKSSSPTKIFQITYTSDNPFKTQDVLTALQTVYRDYNIQQQEARLKRGLKVIDDQLPNVNGELRNAEKLLEQFRRDQELVDPKIQAQAKSDQLSKIQIDLQANLSQIRELQSRYAGLQQQLLTQPQQAALMARLSQSGRYQTLLTEIQKTELALAQQQLRFKNNTDFVQQVAEQRQKQLQLLRTEAQRILGDRTAGASPEGLIAGGQLSNLDTTLVNQLVEAQVNLSQAQARYFSLVGTENQLRSELSRYPQLLSAYGQLEPQVELQRQTLQQLLKARQDIGLSIAQGGFDWQIVEAPLVGVKTGPNLNRNLLLGAVAGLFVAGLSAFAREAMDDGVHRSEDLQRQTAFPLLGMIPRLYIEAEPSLAMRLPFQKKQSLVPDIGELMRWQPFREAMDLMYQKILLASRDRPLKSIVLTSALAGEGKSTIALGLALSAARLNRRVLVIDADLRRPSLHRLLGLPNEQGLVNLLTSQEMVGLTSFMDEDDRNNISIITSGANTNDPAKLLSSRQMQELMQRFRDRYDLVIVDAPPVLGMVDAMLLASHCDSVLMVGRLDQVTRSDIAKAMESMKQFNVLGVVANAVTESVTSNPDYVAASAL